MSFAPELNNFNFRVMETVGRHSLEIVCKKDERVMLTLIEIPFIDADYDRRCHTVLISYVPLHNITDLMATIKEQMELARKHLIIMRPELEKSKPNWAALEDAFDVTSMSLVNFFSLDVLINARQFLKEDLIKYSLPYNIDGRAFSEAIAPDQTVIELPEITGQHSVFITIETDRPFGEIKSLEDFNYKISKVHIKSTSTFRQEVDCTLQKEILEQINQELNSMWEIHKIITHKLIWCPPQLLNEDGSDWLPF